MEDTAEAKPADSIISLMALEMLILKEMWSRDFSPVLWD
jgi:hypothetical protein